MAQIQHTDAEGHTTVTYSGTVADAIAECLANVDIQVAAQKLIPVTYPAANAGLLIDDASRSNIGSMVTDALVAKADGSWDATLAWPMADGSKFPLATPDAMIALGKFAMTAFRALLTRADTARDAINKAQAPADAYAVMF